MTLSIIIPAYNKCEVSVVIPCLNEADTLELCIKKAQQALLEHRVFGEVIVADNGSTDCSQAIAARAGARVINIEPRGYGNALSGGIAAAHGKYIIMGDADGSYDFSEISRFVEKMREGFDLVQGCRLPRGGGKVMPGAMPFSHRWFGNPMFSFLARLWFRSPVHDIYCGMRAFTKELYKRLDLRCTGMEFAVEMIIKASLARAKIAEIPITLYQDGRKSHKSHLKTFRDGWRTLRFFLMFSHRWLFLVPGLVLVVIGLGGYALAMPGFSLGGINFDVHTLLFASLAVLLGLQSMLFAVFSKVFAISERFMPEDKALARFFKLITLERGLLIGLGMILLGLMLLFIAVNQWRLVNFGNLDYAKTMRLVIPGFTLTALGFQAILAFFFISILQMNRK